MVKVLVVDDEKGMRDFVRKTLEGVGHRVVEGRDGKVGLTVFRRECPDLVIIDIIMPEMDGIEAVATMRKEVPGVKILAVSGGGRAHAMDLLAIAPKAGADATLEKPFRTWDLLAMVGWLIGDSEPGSGRGADGA